MTKKKKDKTKKIAWLIFIIILAGVLFAERFMHPHEVFGIEATPLFNAWFGFLSCAAIVFVSKFLGIFLKRKEGYYKESRVDR